MKSYTSYNITYKYLVFIYVITAAIAFISKIGRTIPSSFLQYGLFMFWISIAIIKLAKNNFKLSQEDKTIKKFLLIFIIPRIIIHIYSLLLYLLGKIDYLTRNTQTYLIIFSVFSIIYIFKRKALIYTFISALISYFIVILYNIFVYGIVTIPHTIIFFFTGDEIYDSASRLYEVHDYTFAIGYIILFYIIIKKKLNKKDLIYLYIFIIFTILGLKRIQVLAIILMIIYSFLSKFFKNKIKFYKFTGYIFMIVAYIYVYMISNSKFFDVLDKIGINSMGRNYYYKAIINLCEFTPIFLGLGRNSVTNLLMTDYSYMNVAGLHSDILKYFVECGFILFGLWMWYYLIKVVEWLNKNYSLRVVSSYFILTLYSFIIFYTDNIDTYFVSQFIYILIVSIIPLQFKEKVKKVSYNN